MAWEVEGAAVGDEADLAWEGRECSLFFLGSGLRVGGLNLRGGGGRLLTTMSGLTSHHIHYFPLLYSTRKSWNT